MRHQNDPNKYQDSWENPDGHAPMTSRPRPMFDPEPSDRAPVTPTVPDDQYNPDFLPELLDFLAELRAMDPAAILFARQVLARLEKILNG